MSKEADKLCEFAWKVFCKEFPKAVNSMSLEKLERYKSAWLVGFYFSLHPQFKPIKRKIDELLVKDSEAEKNEENTAKEN